MKQIVLKIYGTVQGVFYRAEAQKMALSLGLVGMAQNLDDGTVEIVAQGEKENLKRLIEWAYKGSKLAKVEKIDCQWTKATGNYADFQIE